MDSPKLQGIYEWKGPDYEIRAEKWWSGPKSGYLMCGLEMGANARPPTNTCYVFLVDASSVERWPLLAGVAETLFRDMDPTERRRCFIVYSDGTMCYDKLADFRAAVPGATNGGGNCEANYYELFRTMRIYLQSAKATAHENTIFVHIAAAEKGATHKEIDEMVEGLLREISGAHNFALFTLLFPFRGEECPTTNIFQIMHQFCPPMNNIYYFKPDNDEIAQIEAAWKQGPGKTTTAVKELLGPVYSSLTELPMFGGRALVNFKSSFLGPDLGARAIEIEVELQNLGNGKYFCAIPFVPDQQNLQKLEFLPRFYKENGDSVAAALLDVQGPGADLKPKFGALVTDSGLIHAYCVVHILWFFALQIHLKNDKIQLADFHKSCSALIANINGDNDFVRVVKNFGQNLLGLIEKISSRTAKNTDIGDILCTCSIIKDMGAIIVRDAVAAL